MAKKWFRPTPGMMAMARRVLAMLTRAAARPMRNCRRITRLRSVATNRPARQAHPATISSQAESENQGELPVGRGFAERQPGHGEGQETAGVDEGGFTDQITATPGRRDERGDPGQPGATRDPAREIE